MAGWNRTDVLQHSPAWPPHAGGRFYGNFVETGVTTVALVANIMYAIPFCVPTETTYTEIWINVTTLKAASNIRLGVYRDSGAGEPGALVLDAGSVSGGAVALVGIVISQKLAPGWYWLACIGSDTPSVHASNAGFRALGLTSGTDTTTHFGWSVAQAYGALPDPFTGGGALMTTSAPRVLLSL